MPLTPVHITPLNSLSGTIPATTAGNCLVVCIMSYWPGTGQAVSSVKAGGSADNFTQAFANAAQQCAVFAWVDPGYAGGQTTISITGTELEVGAEQGGVVVYEIPGITGASAVDRTVSASSASGASWSSGATLETTQDDELWIGLGCTFNTITAPGTGGWTDSGAGFGFACSGYQSASAEGTPSYAGSQSSSGGAWAAGVLTLFAASAASGSAALAAASALAAGSDLEGSAMLGALAALTGMGEIEGAATLAASSTIGTTGLVSSAIATLAASSALTGAPELDGSVTLAAAGELAASGGTPGSASLAAGSTLTAESASGSIWKTCYQRAPDYLDVSGGEPVTAQGFGTDDKVPLSGGLMTGPLISEESIVAGVVVLTYASTIAVDAQLGGHFRLTLAGNPTIGTPASPEDGQKITFELIQDSAGGRTVTWGAGYDFGSSGTVTLTSTAGKRDLVGFVYSADAGVWMCAGLRPGF